MDVTVPINGTRINLRVAVFVDTPEGFVFEKDKKGFWFPAGGRIKINESSAAAAAREIKEELGLDNLEFSYWGTLENFFSYRGEPFHEISMVYYTETDYPVILPDNFQAFPVSEIKGIDIRPSVVPDILGGDRNELFHMVIRDNQP